MESQKKNIVKAKWLNPRIFLAYILLKKSALIRDVDGNNSVKKYHINHIMPYNTERKFLKREVEIILEPYKSILAIVKGVKRGEPVSKSVILHSGRKFH